MLASNYFLYKDEGGRHSGFDENYRPPLYIKTADATGILRFPAEVEDPSKQVMPGNNVETGIDLIHPTPMEVDQSFNIRECDKKVGTGLMTRILAVVH